MLASWCVRASAPRRLIGCATYDGWVTAASRWDSEPERKRVLPALPGSYEAQLHLALPGNYLLPLGAGTQAAGALREKLLERAIGVRYIPATEKQSHYFLASLPGQFDAVLHIDRSEAVQPLDAQTPHGPPRRPRPIQPASDARQRLFAVAPAW